MDTSTLSPGLAQGDRSKPSAKENNFFEPSEKRDSLLGKAAAPPQPPVAPTPPRPTPPPAPPADLTPLQSSMGKSESIEERPSSPSKGGVAARRYAEMKGKGPE